MSDQGNSSGTATPTSAPTPTSNNSPSSTPQTSTPTMSQPLAASIQSNPAQIQTQTVSPIQHGTLVSSSPLTQILPSQPQTPTQIQPTQIQTAQLQAPTAGAVVRSSLPQVGQMNHMGQIPQVGQTVGPVGQVGHVAGQMGQVGQVSQIGQVQFLQPVNNPFALQQQQQFNFQQQFMFQNSIQNAAAVQAMQAQALNTQVSIAPVLSRPSSVDPSGNSQGLVSQATMQVWPEQKSLPSSQAIVSPAVATQTSKPNVMGAKPMGNTSMPQQQAMAQVIGQKQVIQQRPGQAPLMIGPLGVLSNAGVNVSGQQVLANQPKSPAVVSQPGQIIGSPTQLRFSGPHTFVTNTGHIFTGSPAMLNQFHSVATLQQNMQQQPVLGSQSATFLGTQPLYIRQTGPLPQQAQIVGNVQAVTPQKGKVEVSGVKIQGTAVKPVTTTPAVKGVANILPQSARPVAPCAVGAAIRPAGSIQVRPAANIQPKTPVGIQPKQMAKGKNIKVAGKTSSPTSTPTRIAPNPVQVRPGLVQNKTPTIVVQPKPQTITAKPVEIKPVPVILPSVNPMTAASNTETAPAPLNQSPVIDSVVSVDSPVNGSVIHVQPTEVKQEEDEERTETQQDTPPSIEVVVNGGRQKAIVKPNVLTHIIGGFVIQEAPEPFPVQRSAMIDSMVEKAGSLDEESELEKDDKDEDRPPKKSKTAENDKESDDDQPKLKCEFCGKMDLARKFRRSKRFCSMACSKRYNVGCSRRMGLFQSRNGGGKYSKKKKNLPLMRTWKRGQEGRVTTGPIQRPPDSMPLTSSIAGSLSGTSAFPPENTSVATATESSTSASDTERDTERSTTPSVQDESSCPRSPPELERVVQMDIDITPPSAPAPKHQGQEEPGEVLPPMERRHPSKWTVNDVFQFIKSLPGCQMYADEFNRQEIDGQALMLLKEDHLMTAMSIKLGPALKICARINQLKDELS